MTIDSHFAMISGLASPIYQATNCKAQTRSLEVSSDRDFFNLRAFGDPSMQLFFHGTDNSIMVEQKVQAGVGSKNGYLTQERKHGPAT
jgi:hypothetical protein